MNTSLSVNVSHGIHFIWHPLRTCWSRWPSQSGWELTGELKPLYLQGCKKTKLCSWGTWSGAGREAGMRNWEFSSWYRVCLGWAETTEPPITHRITVPWDVAAGWTALQVGEDKQSSLGGQLPAEQRLEEGTDFQRERSTSITGTQQHELQL